MLLEDVGVLPRGIIDFVVCYRVVARGARKNEHDVQE
jgi:hypothetical protein